MKLPPHHLHPQTNAAWLYEKAYFFDLDWAAGDKDTANQTNLEDRNEALFQIRFADPPAPQGNQGWLELTTTYPGLLTGSGYAHEMGFEGELKLGFSLDYTTGRPYLPGSSVKGRLRQAFADAAFHPFLQQLLKDLLGELPASSLPGEDFSLLAQLTHEIFEGKRTQEVTVDGETRWAYQPIPTHARDVFFDAFALASAHPSPAADLDQGFLGPDYLTPHLNRNFPVLSPFTDPVPIAFMKVLPKVTFGFDFRLQDSLVWPALTAAKKRELFQQLLLELGIGAKTNVGYGRFERPFPAAGEFVSLTSKPAEAKKAPQKPGENEGPVPPPDPPKPQTIAFDQLRRGTKLEAEVIAHEGRGKLVLSLDISDFSGRVEPVRAATSLFPVGTKLRVEINHKDANRISVNSPKPKDIISKP